MWIKRKTVRKLRPHRIQCAQLSCTHSIHHQNTGTRRRQLLRTNSMEKVPNIHRDERETMRAIEGTADTDQQPHATRGRDLSGLTATRDLSASKSTTAGAGCHVFYTSAQIVRCPRCATRTIHTMLQRPWLLYSRVRSVMFSFLLAMPRCDLQKTRWVSLLFFSDTTKNTAQARKTPTQPAKHKNIISFCIPRVESECHDAPQAPTF